MNFKDFVMMQNPNRDIDHSCGWSSCAVGDFLDEVAGESYVECYEPEIIGDWFLCNCLGENGYFIVYNEETKNHYHITEQLVINTYGDIQKYYNGELEIYKVV